MICHSDDVSVTFWRYFAKLFFSVKLYHLWIPLNIPGALNTQVLYSDSRKNFIPYSAKAYLAYLELSLASELT